MTLFNAMRVSVLSFILFCAMAELGLTKSWAHVAWTAFAMLWTGYGGWIIRDITPEKQGG